MASAGTVTAMPIGTSAIIASYATKPYGYIPDPKNWEGDGLVAVRPVIVFAWRFESFNSTATRFSFGS